MSLIPNPNQQTDKIIAPEGTHLARIYRFFYLGEHNRTWQGKDLTPAPKFSISFEIPAERHEFTKEKGNQPISGNTLITYSMSDPDRLKDTKSTFSRMLLALGGKQEYIKLYSHLTANITTQSEAMLAINEYIQKFNTCMITVTHNEKGYANIDQYTETMKGMTVHERENELLMFDFWKNRGNFDKLPEFQVKLVEQSNNWNEEETHKKLIQTTIKDQSLPVINVDDLNVQMPF